MATSNVYNLLSGASKTTAPTTWDSGLKVLSEPEIIVPYKILLVCKKISEKVGHREFSILVKGHWGDDGFVLGEEYVIPKQTVSSASVDYDEELTPYKTEGYNTVIHAHPRGVTSFSTADIESINSHFDCSVLYTNGEFTDAVIKVHVNDNIILQVPALVSTVFSDEIEVDTSNIQIYKPKPIKMVSKIDNKTESKSKKKKKKKKKKGKKDDDDEEFEVIDYMDPYRYPYGFEYGYDFNFDYS